MRPAPLPRVMAIIPLLALALAVSACGGNNNASSSTGGGGSSSAASTSASAAASAAASTGSGGGGSTDLGSLVDAFKPPNSTQTVRTDATDAVFVAYTSTDSPDSLKSFYENAIKNAGMNIISTTSAGGSTSWIFTKAGDESFGGSVALGAGPDGTGSSVSITLGKS